MLTIVVPGVESFDNRTKQFVYGEETILELEHSLVSLSKWEMQFQKPLLSQEPKTQEETFAYFRHMCLTPNVPDEVFDRLPDEAIVKINEYIENKMTATWFRPMTNGPRSSEQITNELIYYWMYAFNIPKETEKWHLERLFTLIRVTNEKNKPQKKMSRADLAARNRALNEQRKKQFQTTG